MFWTCRHCQAYGCTYEAPLPTACPVCRAALEDSEPYNGAAAVDQAAAAGAPAPDPDGSEDAQEVTV